MATYILGNGVPITTTVVVDGAPTDPSSISLSIELPDGTIVTRIPSSPSTGVFMDTYVPTVAGRYVWRFVADSDETFVTEGEFDVRAAYDEGLVTVDDLRSHLSFSDNDHTQDDKLQGYIDAATPVIEDITGPIIQRSVTETFDGGGYFVMLSQTPVVSVVSAFEYAGVMKFPLTQEPLGGPTLQDGYGFTLDTSIGKLVRRVVGSGAGVFAPGKDNVVVTYTSGYTITPPNVRLATLELLSHWWKQGQQGERLLGGNTDMTLTSSGYAVPNRVIELCKPHRRPMGIA